MLRNAAAAANFEKTLADAIAERSYDLAMYKFGWCQGMLAVAMYERTISEGDYEAAANRVSTALSQWSVHK